MPEKILYKAGKPERGTAFEIYTDETIIIKRKLTLPSIHIPARAHNWMDIIRSNKENKNSIRLTIKVNEDKRDNEIISNQIATLEKKTNSWFLELSNINEIKMKISQYRDSKVTCTIYGLKPTKLFYKNRDLLEYKSNKEEKNIQWLMGSKRRGSSFNIYQTSTRQLQIESFCWLGICGQIELSQELWRYIKDWWKLKNRYVVGAIDDGLKTVLRFSQRKKKKRLVKQITIPYCGPRKRIKVVFTHPLFELSESAKQDLSLTKELYQSGYNIKKLTTNWTDKPRHIDEEFEEKVWNILNSAFTEEDSKIFSEVKITTACSPQITKRLDGLLIWEELLGLIEIKTSEHLKNNPINEVIGELLFLQKQIQKDNILSIVFLNTEITTTEIGKKITKLYGLVNNIILIGKEEVAALTNKPEQLIERILEHHRLEKGKIKSNQFIHPTTYKLTTKDALEQEAYSILNRSILNSAEANHYIEHYCFRMNLTKADYSLLYKETAEQLNNKVDFDLGIQNRINVTQPIYLEEEILQTLHATLVEYGNLSILESKTAMNNEQSDYKTLLENWETISEVLPPLCNIVQFKTLKSKSGFEYEKHTREILENSGFQVVSNILFSHYGKQFEVDHLIFREGEMQAISCKDRGTFQYLPNLYSKIRFAIGEISLHQKTINCQKSQLYIKAQEEFLPKLNSMFHDYRTENFALEVTK